MCLVDLRPNITQRVFDVLKASPELLSVTQIAERTKLDDDMVRGALQRLRDHRALTTVCQDRGWTYGVKASAKRPEDRRGMRHGGRRKVDD